MITRMMVPQLTLKSPAKINLFLRVLHRRADGYHALASLFQTINLCDELTFIPASADHLHCSDPNLPTDSSNLICKAVQLFRQKTGVDINFQIHLKKQIPIQAGLGGGSSNAATTLWALNKLCDYPATPAQLAEWSAEIGSDIPFFFSSGSAYCTGRGEQVRSLPPLPQRQLLIVKPACALSTALVYSRVQEALFAPSKHSKLDPAQALEQWQRSQDSFFNDLEFPAFQLAPELAELKSTLLSSGFSSVLMCGSGSSLFCMGNGLVPQRPFLNIFPAAFMQRNHHKWYE
jgi:4-diphosphocytidyl-2-C-methyl-D-erythritol kinase